MARLTQAQKHAASVIAHALYMTSMAQTVDGMKGLEEHYLKTLSPNERSLVKFFKEELKRIPKDLARMMEEENRNGTPS